MNEHKSQRVPPIFQKTFYFFKKFLANYQNKRNNIYYWVNRFALTTSITVLTVVFSINANVIKQYENYYWLSPFSILEFVNQQLALDKNPAIEEIKLYCKKEPPQNYRFLFLIDRTSSTRLSKEMEVYTDEIRQSIYDEMDNSLKAITKDQLDSLSLQEMLCLSMLLSLYQPIGTEESPFGLYTSIAYYDGDSTLNYLDWDNKKAKDCYLQFDHSLTKSAYYTKMVTKFLEERRKFLANNSANHRTDFELIFNEIKGSFFEETEGDPKNTILTIYSDFHHDIAPVKPEQQSVPLDLVEDEIRALASNEHIHQVNLVRFPKLNADSRDLDETNRLVQAIKTNFSNSYYYFIEAKNLVNQQSIEERVKEILSPTEVYYNNDITFYYPYRDNKLGASKEARAAIALNNLEKKDYECFISFHSNEVLNDPRTKLTLRVKDDKVNRQKIKTISNNMYVYEEFDAQDTIGASYYNYIHADQYSDLSFNIYLFNSNYKIRIPITFKEKLSALNAKILGVTTALTLISALLIFLFIIFDNILEFKKDKIKMNSPNDQIGFQIPIYLTFAIGSIIITFGMFIRFRYLNNLHTTGIWFILAIIFISLLFFWLYCYDYQPPKSKPTKIEDHPKETLMQES